MRKVIYLSGTRADFGLIASTLRRIKASSELDISVCVTGMHLDAAYGNTVKEIESSGIRICARIPVDLANSSSATMVRSMGHELLGLAGILDHERPDILMVLGDRGEMLAGAIAAVNMNITVVHLHGGELSGTVDELFRHAITKLSHYHFVSTHGARERIIRMGEHADHVFVTGAPGLDGINEAVAKSRIELCNDIKLDPQKPIALVVFHPVVQQADYAAIQTEILIRAIIEYGDIQAVVMLPNCDVGGDAIRAKYKSYDISRLRFRNHFQRDIYLSWLAAADFVIGNSSSGIIEAASLGTVAINVGDRQKYRERSNNVIDVKADYEEIKHAIKHALSLSDDKWENVYGDGRSGERIVELLENIPLNKHILEKTNAY